MYKDTTKNQVFIVHLAKIHLFVILSFGLLTSLFFILSNIDLYISSEFYNFTTKIWQGNQNNWERWVYVLGVLPQVLLLDFAFVGWCLSYLKQSNFRWIPTRESSLFILFSILGSELLVEILKQSFARPRPRNIELFGGEFSFAPLYSIGEAGLSFPSSHAKSGFILILLFYVLYPKYKKFAQISLIFSLALGLLLSYVRISQGGHFLSDCVIAVVVSHLVILFFFFQKKPIAKNKILTKKWKRIFLYFIIILVPVLSITLYIIKFFP